MLDIALQYAARGWPIFPLSGYKVPFKGTHGHLDATTDATTITEWWRKRPSANIGLATGRIVAIDLDGAAPLSSARGQLLATAAATNGGLPRTLTSRTARGVHLLYLAPAGVSIRSSNERRKNSGEDGVDIKGEGGFIVLPPSISAKNKFQYKWLHAVPIATMPPWLSNWLQELRPSTQIQLGVGNLGAKPAYLQQNQGTTAQRASKALTQEYNINEHKRLASALAAIPADHYDTWIEVGMALQSLGWERSDGTSIGFDLWDRWSASCPAKYNPIGMADKWASFGRSGRSEISIATVYHYAGRSGWQPPAPRAAEERKVMPDNQHATETTPQPVLSPPAGAVNGHVLPAALTAPSDSDSPLIKLNNQYAVIGDVGGKCLVMGWVKSKVDETVQVPSFQTFKSFAERYSNQYVMVQKPKGDDWVEEPAQVGSTWLKWRQRRTFEGIDLDPDGENVLPGNVLNLWNGFAITPAPGDWSHMKEHIGRVLARSDIISMEYILKWSAWKVQRPGERAEVALVFKGAKGSGKGTFANALRRMFGQHSLQIWNSKHLVGSFNGHLRNCLLLYADEAFWAGDKQGESVLKGMLTEPSLMIEQKGVDATPWRNRIGVIMTANADWVVPASHDERRYAVFDVSDARIKDKKYFKALYHEMANGGLSAMLYDLQHAKLGDWHPRAAPQTDALQQQKLRSLDPRFEWFENLLSDGTLIGAAKHSTIVPMNFLHVQARETVPRLRDVSQTALGRFLAEMGCEKIHTDKGNGWRFRPLAEHRDSWVQKFGRWRWSYAGAEWVVR